MRLNESRRFESVLFQMQPPIQRETALAAGGSYQPRLWAATV